LYQLSVYTLLRVGSVYFGREGQYYLGRRVQTTGGYPKFSSIHRLIICLQIGKMAAEILAYPYFGDSQLRLN